jgi:hypothetical protein
MLSNIHQIPSLRVDATYYSAMHFVLDEGITNKIQVLSMASVRTESEIAKGTGFRQTAG